MSASKAFAACLAALVTAAANAATIDMSEARRALGREDDVRIDAQLLADTVSPGSPIGVTWQIQNFSDMPVAVASRVIDTSYDADSHTITVGIGSEVPDEGNMPVMIVVAPGEKRVFRAAATPAVGPAAFRTGGGTPRFVRVKVSILRKLAAFMTLIQEQATSTAPQRLSDELFEQWFESTDTIFLNTLPVHWSARAQKPAVDVERRGDGF